MKKIITILIIIICFSANSQKIEAHEKWIDSLLKTNQKVVVEKLLLEQLKDKKKQNYTNRSLGYFYLKNKKYDLSEKYYRAELISKPKCAECHYFLGRVYSRKKDFKIALIYLDKAIALEPKNSILYANRGKFKADQNDKIGAQIDYDKAIEINPNDAELYNLRAKYFFNERLNTLALLDCNKSINFNPKEYSNYLQRAQINFSQYKYNEALKDIEKAISLNPNQDLSYNLRSLIYASQGEYYKANSDLEKAIELNPNDFMAFFMRSKIRYKAEDMNGSCQDLSKSLELLDLYDSENNLKSEIENSIAEYCKIAKPSYYYQRGIALFNSQEFEKSIIEHSKGLEKFPNNSMLHMFRANSFYSSQKFEKAIIDYQKSNQNIENLKIDMRENPNYNTMETAEFEKYVNATIANNFLFIAKSNFELVKYENALTAIDDGLKIMPDIHDFGQENFYNIRGAINMSTGEYEKAILDFDKCLAINSSMPIALINRAISKMNLNTRVKNKVSSMSIINNIMASNDKYEFPVQSKTEYSKTDLEAALLDCNLAIEQYSSFGFAYFVRGQIKKLLDRNDFCNDFRKAKKLDYLVDNDLLINCK